MFFNFHYGEAKFMQNKRTLITVFGAFFIPLALFLSLSTHPAFAQGCPQGYCAPVINDVIL